MRRPAVPLLVVVLAAACGRAPARLVAGRADTVIVNNRRPVPLPVVALDARGRETAVRGLRFRRLGGDAVALADSGWVTCDRPGDATVEVRHGALATRFTLMCRPIVGFRSRPPATLALGGPPEPLPLDAVGVHGESVAPIMGSATVRDTSVAAVRAMHILPRAAGGTRVEVEAGDCATSIWVRVYQPVRSSDSLRAPFQSFAAPVQLVAGEVRTWRIPAGDYEVTLDTDRPIARGARPYTLGLAGGQCNGSHCLALRPAVIVLQHLGAAGQGTPIVGTLSVQRSDAWPVRRASAPPRPARRLGVAPRRTPSCKTFPPA